MEADGASNGRFRVLRSPGDEAAGCGLVAACGACGKPVQEDRGQRVICGEEVIAVRCTPCMMALMEAFCRAVGGEFSIRQAEEAGRVKTRYD